MLECGSTPILLEAIGFEYDCEMAPDAFKRAVGSPSGVQYLGWLIKPNPGWGVISVIHLATRHLWIFEFRDRAIVSRVKVLIRKGFEMDLQKMMMKNNFTQTYLLLACDDWIEVFKQLNKAELGVLYYIRCLDPSQDGNLDIDTAEISKKLDIHRTTVSRSLNTLVSKGLLAKKYAKETRFSIEKQVRDRLQVALGGLIEVITPIGRIDLLTDTEIIEVKVVNDWKAGMGQVLAYSAYFPSHEKRLHLFHQKGGKFISDSWEAKRICSDLEIIVTIEELESDC